MTTSLSKLTISSDDDDAHYVVITNTVKIGNRRQEAQVPGYSAENEWEDEPNQKKDFKSVKGMVYNEAELFKRMIGGMKDVSLDYLVEAVERWQKYSTPPPSIAWMPISCTECNGKLNQVPMTRKAKDQAWCSLIDKFLDFLKFFYQENRELVPERMARNYEDMDMGPQAAHAASQSETFCSTSRGN